MRETRSHLYRSSTTGSSSIIADTNPRRGSISIPIPVYPFSIGAAKILPDGRMRSTIYRAAATRA